MSEAKLKEALGLLARENIDLRRALRDIVEGHRNPQKRAAEAICLFEEFRTVDRG